MQNTEEKQEIHRCKSPVTCRTEGLGGGASCLSSLLRPFVILSPVS